ncbi:hypothetical protein [Streptomyces sp. NPDC059909]|uniref:hypothetical protein n=1 Tax=Streptomyces sp. NPDC059909 TaxID=3346998 RepID=UPI00365BC8D5
MRITDKDDINHTELARILGISMRAAIRGRFTTRQQARINQILEQARKREQAKKAK